MGRANQRDGDRRLARWAALATIVGLPIALISLLGGGDTEPARHRPHLQRAGPAAVFDAPARLDIKVHNTGGSRLVIGGAVIRVAHVVSLRLCYTQGDLGVTNDYKVGLPTSPGRVVVPLHQQLGADEADRFVLTFAVPTEDAVRRKYDRPPVTYIYELSAALQHDDAHRNLYLGRFVLSVPDLPSLGEFFLPRRAQDQRSVMQILQIAPPDVRAEVIRSYRSNARKLQAVRQFRGQASPGLKKALQDAAVSVAV